MNQITSATAVIDESKTAAHEEHEAFEMPTLDQFMELINGESDSLKASPSAYNVYNKYNKTS